MNIRHSITLSLAYDTSAGDLTDFLKDAPLESKVSVGVIKGDRNEMDTYSITLSWITWPDA